MRMTLCLAALLVCSGPAWAGACEEDFQAVGDPRNGLLLMAQVKMPGLSINSALGQLQKIAADDKLIVGNETIAQNQGELLLTQTNVNPPIVIRAEAKSSGEVALGAKLAKGQKVKPEDARSYMCGLLAKLKTGKEGEAIAAAARAKSGSGQVIDAKADKLSAEIGREVKKATNAANRPTFKDLLLNTPPTPSSSEVNGVFAPVQAKYMGRKYRIDGQVYTLSQSYRKGAGRIAFLVTQTRSLLAVRQSSTFNSLNFTIECEMAKDQRAYFSTLGEQDWVTLTGTVDEFRPSGMVLGNCRQAN